MPDAQPRMRPRSPAGEILELVLGYACIAAPWVWHVACVTMWLPAGGFWLAAPLALALGALWGRAGGTVRSLDVMVAANVALVHVATLTGVGWFLSYGLAPVGYWTWALWLSLGSVALFFVWRASRARRCERAG